MPKIPTGKKRESAPEGTHNAVCVNITDLGTQTTNFKGEEKTARKILLGWQLVDELTEDGEPILVYKRYTYSDSAKATLMKDLKSWVGVKSGADFDIATLLGKGCLVSVENNEADNGNVYSNVTSVAGVPKGVKVGKPSVALKSFFLDEEEFDEDAFDELSDKLKETIAASPEYIALTTGKKKPAAKGKQQAPAKKGKK
jgi:hypothetical protein